MKSFLRLIIILGVITLLEGLLTVAKAQEKKNLIWQGDFEKHYSRTYIYDGVDSTGYLDVGANSSPASGDINGDGKKDLVVGSEEGLIYCYLNQGTDEAPKFTSAYFFQPYYYGKYSLEKTELRKNTFGDIKVHLVDWNSDGKKDILFGTRRGWVFILEGNGAGEFGSGVKIRKAAKPIAGLTDFDIGSFAAPAACDWNGDGKKDLLLGEGTYGADSVYVFLNEGSDSSPSFSRDKRQYLAYGEGREHLTPAPIDWDNDGDYDLIVGERIGYFNLFINNPSKRGVGEAEKVVIAEYSKQVENVKTSYPTPYTVDWDNDGDLDILSGSSDGRIYLSLNTGTKGSPRFSSPKTLMGEDKQASINHPSSWTQSYNWMQRDGVYLLEIDATEPYAGKGCLKLSSIENYPGKVDLGIDVSLHYDKNYIFTFYTKGGSITGPLELSYSSRVVEEGQRKLKHTSTTLSQVSSSSGWRETKTKFKVPPLVKGAEAEKDKQRYMACTLKFRLEGAGPVFLDEVSLIEVE